MQYWQRILHSLFFSLIVVSLHGFAVYYFLPNTLDTAPAAAPIAHVFQVQLMAAPALPPVAPAKTDTQQPVKPTPPILPPVAKANPVRTVANAPPKPVNTKKPQPATATKPKTPVKIKPKPAPKKPEPITQPVAKPSAKPEAAPLPLKTASTLLPTTATPQPKTDTTNTPRTSAPPDTRGGTKTAAQSASAKPAPIRETAPIFNAAYLNNPAPEYPRSARLRRESGTVQLRVQVSAAGAPLTVQLQRSSGSSRLDEAAKQAVKGWRFVPARRGEQAVSAWVIVPIHFKL